MNEKSGLSTRDFIIGIMCFLFGFILAISFMVYQDNSDVNQCELTCLQAGLYGHFCLDFCDDFEVNWTNFLMPNSTEVQG